MRQALMGDMHAIGWAIAGMCTNSPARQMRHIDIPTARKYIEQAITEGRCVFRGGYMILFDVGSDWYSNTKVLIEQLILKVYPDNKEATVDDAIATLDLLKETYGCAAVIVGDTQIGYMTPRYQAAGYQVLGTQLMK